MTLDLSQIELPGLPAPPPPPWRQPRPPRGGGPLPLGSQAGSVAGTPDQGAAERVEKSKRNRRKAHELLGGIQRATTRRRVRGCCRCRIGADGMVELKARDGVAYFAGLQRCASVWLCPVCSAKIAGVRRAEIERVGRLHMERGGSIATLTLTTRHDAGMNGRALRKVVAAGWRAVQQNRAYREKKASLKMTGFCRAFEVTHGENGFHPHIHVALFFARDFSPRVVRETWTETDDQGNAETFHGSETRELNQELAEFREVIFAAWTDAIVGAGYPAPTKEHGVDLSVVRPGSRAWGRYLSKIGFEFADNRHKVGRHENRSMWEIAESAGESLLAARMEGRSVDVIRGGDGIWRGARLTDQWVERWIPPETDDGYWQVATFDGEVFDIESTIPDVQIWRDFEAMIFGARQLEWSRGMRALYQVDVQTDLEIVTRDEHGDLVVGFPKEVWRQIRRRGTGALPDLLEAGAEGPTAVLLVLYGWGIRARVDELRWPGWVDDLRKPGG